MGKEVVRSASGAEPRRSEVVFGEYAASIQKMAKKLIRILAFRRVTILLSPIRWRTIPGSGLEQQKAY